MSLTITNSIIDEDSVHSPLGCESSQKLRLESFGYQSRADEADSITGDFVTADDNRSPVSPSEIILALSSAYDSLTCELLELTRFLVAPCCIVLLLRIFILGCLACSWKPTEEVSWSQITFGGQMLSCFMKHVLGNPILPRTIKNKTKQFLADPCKSSNPIPRTMSTA